ncbi:hypothetical protein [Butyricicoccus sp.]|uniref:hypothetical protein n=1 Tax=Butyricicoccus sp. TaxID=2049021 RepID=UPI003D7C8981
MDRTFELSAHANSSGYGVTLKINGRPFATAAVRKNGDTVGSTYRQITSQLRDVYGDIDRNRKCFDIVEARDQVYRTICALNSITKENTQ